MDGNGRWAKNAWCRGLRVIKLGWILLSGLQQQPVILALKVLTLYAFSTEKYSRPNDEVNFFNAVTHWFFSTDFASIWLKIIFAVEVDTSCRKATTAGGPKCHHANCWWQPGMVLEIASPHAAKHYTASVSWRPDPIGYYPPRISPRPYKRLL